MCVKGWAREVASALLYLNLKPASLNTTPSLRVRMLSKSRDSHCTPKGSLLPSLLTVQELSFKSACSSGGDGAIEYIRIKRIEQQSLED